MKKVNRTKRLMRSIRIFLMCAFAKPNQLGFIPWMICLGRISLFLYFSLARALSLSLSVSFSFSFPRCYTHGSDCVLVQNKVLATNDESA